MNSEESAHRGECVRERDEHWKNSNFLKGAKWSPDGGCFCSCDNSNNIRFLVGRKRIGNKLDKCLRRNRSELWNAIRLFAMVEGSRRDRRHSRMLMEWKRTVKQKIESIVCHGTTTQEEKLGTGDSLLGAGPRPCSTRVCRGGDVVRCSCAHSMCCLLFYIVILFLHFLLLVLSPAVEYSFVFVCLFNG